MPMVKRSQYIRIENPLHKHFAGMPMVGGEGSKIEKICRRLKWMVSMKVKSIQCVRSAQGPCFHKLTADISSG